MDDKALNTAVSRFVKDISFSAKREIEKCVRQALASGRLKGDEKFTAGVTVSSDALNLNVTIFSKIEL
jgi:hypothetical protein